MLFRPLFVAQCRLMLLTPRCACGACDGEPAASKAENDAAAAAATFEITPRHRLLYSGQIIEPDKSKGPGVDFGVIPITPLGLKPYYNVFTRMIETRPVPGNEHAIPVLR